MRAGMCVVVRDLIVQSVLTDMMAGVGIGIDSVVVMLLYVAGMGGLIAITIS